MDHSLVTSIAAASLGQALAAVAFAVALQRHHRTSRRHYLRHWAWSWWAAALSLACSTVALAAALAAGGGPLAGLLWLAPALFASCAGLVSLAFLLFGIEELVVGGPSPRIRRGAILAAACGAGPAVTVLLGLAPGSALERAAVVQWVPGPVAGGVSLLAAVALWRMDGRTRRAGPALLASAFLLQAVQELHAFGHAARHLATGSAPLFAGILGYLDLVVLALVGVGMLVWLLEGAEGKLEAALRRVGHLGTHDPLTGLPNRHQFLNVLRTAGRGAGEGSGAERLAVLCVDLHGFTVINESMGHRVGDRVLRRVGERISEAAAEAGAQAVARLGSDEFAILLPEVDRRQQARSVGARVLERLAEPFEVGSKTLTMTGRVGYSVAPEDTTDAESLLSNATAALASARRRGELTAWEPSMSAGQAEGFAVEGELRAALERSELRLVYQPILDLRSRRVERVEALLRWEHPERGLLAPAEFLHAVEPAGLTERIDLWSLERALSDVARWQGDGLDHLGVAVNVSPRNFRQAHLPGEIRRMLLRSGVSPEKLELEITEAAVVLIRGSSLDVLQVLEGAGIGLGLDDFGTGYSSLDYLRRLPIDTVKIDRSFVQDLGTTSGAAEIVRAVINLGRDLGFTVVGEGVEADLQWRLLEELRCDQIQGYALSPPVTAGELPALLEEIDGEPPRWRLGGGVA